MKHLQLFENFQDIDSICKKYIDNYTINPDGSVDVDGDVDLSYRELTKLPLKFGEVTGSFCCSDNQLTSLEGSPKYVGGDFSCGYNKLITLEGGPKEVVGDFYCYGNPIYEIYKFFPSHKSFEDSLDYGYLRGTNIVRSRFKEALEEIEKRVPESIDGYKYIEA